MIKKQRILALVILMYFPVFAHAGIIHLESHNLNQGPFAAPVGKFDSKLNIALTGETTTEGVFSSKTVFRDESLAGLRSVSGVFNMSSNNLRSPNVHSKKSFGQFSSVGLLSSAGNSVTH